MNTPFDITDGYRALLGAEDTEKTIRLLKEFFCGKKGVLLP
jgi:hypothetical protein